MRKLPLLALLGVCLMPWSQAQTIVDTFPGNTLTESHWTISTEGSNGWFEVNDGLTLTNRAHLTTKDEVFGPPLTISGTVTFNSIEDYLTIALRFDGTYQNTPYYESGNGVRVIFGPALLSGGQNYVNIYDVAVDDQAEDRALLDTLRFDHGISYDFLVIDDGSLISLYVDDALLISHEIAANNGGFVGLYSREHSGSPFPGLLLSSINISSESTSPGSAIPEPSTWAILVGSVALGTAIIRRRFHRRA